MGFSKQHGLLNKVTVRIWFPNAAQASTLHSALTVAGLGHAGLTVMSDGVRHYITWQVAEGAPIPFKEHQALNYKTENDYVPLGQMSKAKDESWMSGMRWGQMNGDVRGLYSPSPDADYGYRRSQCDWKKRIKTRQPDGDGTGLDAGAIIRWWDNRVKTETKYELLSTNKNCTGCVAEALKAGGLQGSPKGSWLVSAHDLQTWILDQVNKQHLQAEAGYE